jgi:hypothetical protein
MNIALTNMLFRQGYILKGNAYEWFFGGRELLLALDCHKTQQHKLVLLYIRPTHRYNEE